MDSVGNDIVSLKHINIHRTRQYRFYSKILSVTEQQLYNQQLNIPFENFVWLLWSAKEAAYKYLQRQQPGLIFSPVKIEVSRIIPPENRLIILSPAIVESTGFKDLDCFQANVTLNCQTLYARSVIYSDELIHTIVCGDVNFEKTYWGIKPTLETGQSAAVRSFLRERLSLLYPGKNVSIEKNADGVPSIKIDGDEVIIPVSLSHHGKYVGYVTSILS